MEQNQTNGAKMILREYVDELFANYKSQPNVEEMKEEVFGNMNDKISDYMKQGLSFEEAFERAKKELGDIQEMIEIEQSQQNNNIPTVKPTIEKNDFNSNRIGMLTSLSVLLYVLVGMTFGAWYWFWMIIPVTAILVSPAKSPAKLVSLTPFIYLFLGFFFGLWATAWIIIPAAGIVMGCSKK